jgi:hypothetical protein
MERYLASLTDEFQNRYKPIADAQRDYEAQVKQALATEQPQAAGIRNEAWSELEELPKLREFLAAKGKDFRADFEDPLDLASWLLRAELKRLLGAVNPPLPERHEATRERLIAIGPAAAEPVRPSA